MERLKDYEVKVILCEFPEEYIWNFPDCPGIPYKKRKNIKITGQKIMNQLEIIESDYGILTIFSNDRYDAMKKAFEILKEFENK